MDVVVYEYNQEYVLEAFRRGEFDFVDGMSEVAETEFFRYIGARRILAKMAETYPSPREKEEVPLWMFVASNLSMQYTEMLLTLSAEAGKKILEKVRRLRREIEQDLKLVRPP
jgi:hypothetical protein